MFLIYKTGIYIRLSQEDKNKASNESNSIENQRIFLKKFISESPDLIFEKEYVDDGYTGTNFERPSFIKMLNDINEKKINCILVKDLSRFGRDYLEAGIYIEKIFPEKNIRLIAVNDNYDTLKNQNDFFLPLKNIFNELYSRDISKKCKSILKLKKQNGEFTGAFACYGYKKSEVDKHKLIIDEYPASIVKKIFFMYVNGFGIQKIVHTLNNLSISPPSVYKSEQGYNYKNGKKLFKTSYWTNSTVASILKNEIYIGNMVQGKSEKKALKGKRQKNKRTDWIIVKNTHEPIIPLSLWEKAKKINSSKIKEFKTNENRHIFSGIIVCEKCGRSMCRVSSSTNGKFVCGTYKRFGKKYCTRNSIDINDVENIAFNILNLYINDSLLKNKIKSKNKLQDIKADFNNKLNELKSYNRSLYESFIKGLITEAEMLEYKKFYLNKEVELKEQLNSIKDEKDDISLSSLLKKHWFLTELINKIKISDTNEITLELNFFI